tara:strand:- start:59 stop:1009 length:951 start_codon:yes stop_codon:yes gene_type:complete
MFSSELWNNPGGSSQLTQKAIFGFGQNGGSNTGVTNLVSDSGVVASDTAGVGTARNMLGAAGYGGDKAIFGFGTTGSRTAITNLVSNVGVVASDTAGVGLVRNGIAAAGYGEDKAIFGFGVDDTGGDGNDKTAITNLVSNSGVVASDTAGVGSPRGVPAAAGYGGDKAIFGFGFLATGISFTNLSNLVSNTGVVASDTTGVGTVRGWLGAAGYGEDKAIFGFGFIHPGNANTAITNLVSNTGVVATDTAGVGTARLLLAGAVYGGDKAIFGFGRPATSGSSGTAVTNLVSNSGVVATDTAGVGSVRLGIAAAGYAN